MNKFNFKHENYTIDWIYVLLIELIATLKFLNEKYENIN